MYVCMYVWWWWLSRFLWYMQTHMIWMNMKRIVEGGTEMCMYVCTVLNIGNKKK